MTASFDAFLHITNDLKTFFDKFNIVVKPQKYRHKYRNKLYSRKFGPDVMAILYGFVARCFRCCFPT